MLKSGQGQASSLYICGAASADCYHIHFISERERSRSLYVVVRPSVVCLSSVLSVTFVHPTLQAIEIFGNVSTPFADIKIKFYGDLPRETPPSGE